MKEDLLNRHWRTHVSFLSLLSLFWVCLSLVEWPFDVDVCCIASERMNGLMYITRRVENWQLVRPLILIESESTAQPVHQRLLIVL